MLEIAAVETHVALGAHKVVEKRSTARVIRLYELQTLAAIMPLTLNL